MNLTTTSSLTSVDLAAHGFTSTQIARLQGLKERYDPYREYCESDQEFERLAFLKWRFQQGQFAMQST